MANLSDCALSDFWWCLVVKKAILSLKGCDPCLSANDTNSNPVILVFESQGSVANGSV